MIEFIKRHKFIFTSLVVLVLLILFILVVVIPYLGAGVMTYRTSNGLDASPSLISNNYDNVEFKSTDGIKLAGTLFKKPGSDKLVIMVTGVKPNRFDEFFMTPMIAIGLLDHDYNVLMYDTRAHGLSDGDRVEYGSVSGKDIVGAVDFAKTKGFEPKNIGVIGNSTGAVEIVNVNGQLKDVGALILDSSTDNFTNVLKTQISREGNIPSFFAPAIFFFSQLRFGIDLANIVPINHVKDDPNRAYLFLQGNDDDTTPYDWAKNLYNHTSKDSKFVTFDKAGHVESYRMDRKLWEDSVYSWLDQHLGK